MAKKNEIEEYLNHMELAKAEEALCEYEKLYPMDADILSMRTILAIYQNKLDEAKKWALEGVKRLPSSGDMHYNLAYVCQLKGEYYQAGKEYAKAEGIYGYLHDAEKLTALEINKQIGDLIKQWRNEAIESGDYQTITKCMQELALLENCMAENDYGICEKGFRLSKGMFGRFYYASESEKRYVGVYNSHRATFDDAEPDLLNSKGEFLCVTEGKEYYYTDEDVCLLPIATENADTILHFRDGLGDYTVRQNYPRHFSYYRLQGETDIWAEGNCYFGKPVVLKQDADKKKLVLNIFVDGLAEEVLKGDGLKNIMPNTYHFFSKGTICENAYCAADWTYPSIPNIVTSTNTLDHMLFHNLLENSIRPEVKTLAEYFKDAGYYTSMINMDWRIIPSYGHSRGYDQYIYQNPMEGFKVGEMIKDVVEHIEAFKETNQFVWMTIGDLHDTADGLWLPGVVTKNIDLANRQIEEIGVTSVKQNYSTQKRCAFEEHAKYVDFALGFLFRYIEDNYENDEILISLFADHGQGYLIPEGGHFLGKERSGIAFMFRGGEAGKGVTSELMSSSDYLPIMCKLAGIPLAGNPIDGQVPVWFGGEKEREYAYTESLHPKDPYYASVFTKDCVVCFQSEGTCTDNGQFLLGDYKIWLLDYNNNVIQNDEVLSRYEKVILNHIAPNLIYE